MRLTSYKAGWDAVGWPCGLRLIADKVAGYLGAWLARIPMWLASCSLFDYITGYMVLPPAESLINHNL